MTIPNIWKQRIRRLAKRYSVKVIFEKMDEGLLGLAGQDEIILNNNLSSWKVLISIFFHELGHIYACRNRIWRAYHERPLIMENVSAYLRTQIKAEKWVDRWAFKEMKKVYPRQKGSFHYIASKNRDIRKSLNTHTNFSYLSDLLKKWRRSVSEYEKTLYRQQLEAKMSC